MKKLLCLALAVTLLLAGCGPRGAGSRTGGDLGPPTPWRPWS